MAIPTTNMTKRNKIIKLLFITHIQLRFRFLYLEIDQLFRAWSDQKFAQ